MGLDFIRCRAPTFKKSWNRGKDELVTPNLFTREPSECARTVLAQLTPDARVASGTTVIVAAQGADLIMLEGTHRIGISPAAPAEIVRKIADSGGVAIGKLVGVHPLSDTADVEIP